MQDFEAFNKNLGYDYETAWANKTHDALKVKYPRLTDAVWNAAIDAANKTEPLLPQLESFLKNKY